MKNTTKHEPDEPASLADIASFVFSPWVALSLITIVVVMSMGWRADVAGVYALTPAWFVPYGAVAAAIGMLVSAMLALRQKGAATRLLALLMVFFVPGVCYAVIEAGESSFSAAFKLWMGLLFMIWPWFIAASAWYELKHPASVRR
jgi:hypothetical protein